MKANGIARLGLGCALAQTLNPVFAMTLDESRIGEVLSESAVLSDAAGERDELHKTGDAPFDPNGIMLDDGGRDLRRIETDLLILPGESRPLAHVAAPGAPGIDYSAFPPGDPGDEVVPRYPSGDTLRLAYDRGLEASSRTSEPLALPGSKPCAVRSLDATGRRVPK